MANWAVTSIDYMTRPNDLVVAYKLNWTCAIDTAVREGSTDVLEQNRVYTKQAMDAVPNTTLIQWLHQAMGSDLVTSIETKVQHELDYVPANGVIVK